MPKPFHELSLDEFTVLVGEFSFSRRIESVHVHHTWRPNHATFASRPPLATIEAMYEFHTKVNHWSDLAQHITIDPRGQIWTGRGWNTPPASSTGFNGTPEDGPFMIEMIGDFDTGRDPFDGPQKAAAIGAIAAILKTCSLPADAVRFHNQMSAKTCPGTSIKLPDLLDEIREAMAGSRSPRSEVFSALRYRSQAILNGWTAGSRFIGGGSLGDEPHEDAMNANEVAVITGAEAAASAAGRDLFGGGPEFTPEEKQTLRPHVVDLRLGVFSSGGAFETSLADVQRVFNELLPDELARQQSAGQPLRLIFFAHGGLVSEEEGIRPVLRRLPFWRQNGLYPIFFCWETGLKETLIDLVKSTVLGQRGFVSDVTDELLEAAAGPGGREIWSQMKRVAELASLPGGGARTVAELTSKFWAANHANMEIHAVGHSAGAIFHAFFLPMLLDQKPGAGIPAITVKSLHFLAPACTTALFASKLQPKIGPGNRILGHTMYTMNKDLEQADTAGPYKKSLLYFVSRAFEDQKPTPILGLEESLRDDPALIRFYGLTRTIPGVGQVLFSKTPQDAPLDSATESTRHGDFDNEVKTMNSVARRILNKPTGTIVSFVDETSRNEVSRALAFARSTAASGAAPFVVRAAGPATRTLTGARTAICIGIDSYPEPNALGGCVNDARDWADVLESLTFNVSLLLNHQATRLAILDTLDRTITSAQPGDVIVIQYSGHGTQVHDLDGDETEGLDEALVPIDFTTGSFIIDDDLRELMAKIPAGVNVTCFMDCCHSGTNTRLFAATPATRRDGSRARFLTMTPELTESHIAMRSRMRRSLVAAARSADEMREVNFAACRSDQVAFESNGSGDFTRRAVPILRGGLNGLTNTAFKQRVLDAFGAAARQEPVLQCAASSLSLPLFGVATSAPAGVGASGGDAPGALIGRLDAIERRLVRLGV